jgi:hypothetical protein
MSSPKSQQSQAALFLEWLVLLWSLISRCPRVHVLVGMENRPDNLQTMKDFFYVDVANDSLFSVTVIDVSITYRAPYNRKSIKSIILAEEQAYPIALRARERLRINLLPSVVDLPRVDFIAATLETGHEFRLKSKPPATEARAFAAS